MNLADKVVLVTGATRGIGRAIALHLGRQGAVVVGTATTDAGAAAISDYLQQADIKGMGLVLDVADADAIEVAVSAVEAQFSAPDILVNNAAILRNSLLLRMKDSEWDDVIATNLTSIFSLSKRCVRAMVKARWGRIISITSVIGVMGNIGQANYSAAKAGVIGFSKSLAYEVSARGVTVNTVAPGFIDTDMTRSIPDKQTKMMVANIPIGRIGEPEDIAAAVGFLASMEASYVTGETLHVNGGMYMS